MPKEENTMIKRYVLTAELDDDTMNVSSKNDGLNSFELLGILAWKTNDILKQMAGDIKPDVIKREVMEDK